MKNVTATTFSLLLIAAFLAPQAFGDAPTKKPECNDAKFHKTLLAIAAKYPGYSKVDDMARWAPWLCAAPLPPKLKLSQSKDSGTHGRKLYFLYAANRDEYVANKPPQVGQAIVKESWTPESGVEGEAGKVAFPTPAQKNALFIMTKLATDTPDTDNGWIYGTVTADGKTVTSAGKVESCMGCHVQTKNDRLFGMKENRQF